MDNPSRTLVSLRNGACKSPVSIIFMTGAWIFDDIFPAQEARIHQGRPKKKKFKVTVIVDPEMPPDEWMMADKRLHIGTDLYKWISQ